MATINIVSFDILSLAFDYSREVRGIEQEPMTTTSS